MPLLLEPKQRYAVVLESDKDKPAETQPRFWAYALSARESIQLVEEARAYKSDQEIFDKLKTLVVGWDNMVSRDGNVIEFSPDTLGDILTTNEQGELFCKIRDNDFLSESDKKKSE